MSGRLRCLALPAVALLGIAISGCAGNRELAEQAQQELVGRSTTEIFACAGAPGREIIKSKQNQEVSFFARRDASGFMITSNLGPQTKKGGVGFCQAVFEMFTGVVQEVRYVDADGEVVDNPRHCSVVVRDCLTTPEFEDYPQYYNN